ncbi:MAG: single-stranded DNA-binding protein, partial [Carnobacterium sp.]
TAFGKTAETMGNFLHKGSKILIEGQLSQSTYEKNGEKRSSTDVIVNRFEFLDSKKDSGTSYSKPEPKNDDPFASSGTEISIDSDDLPF